MTRAPTRAAAAAPGQDAVPSDPAGGPGLRLSLAAAMTLGLRSGRSYRDARTGCVNVLLDYPTACLASCAYCGLARGSGDAGAPVRGSFIRVEWPVFDADLVVERIARRSAVVRRLCISMVENARAFDDALALTGRIRGASSVPISVLVHPRGLDEGRLDQLARAGADRIGIGLDAATPGVFARMRPGLDWTIHRTAASAARRVFGPWRVNCHVVTGLGETDRDLVSLFVELLAEQVSPYLFCFYPEAGSRLARRARPTLKRWRRVQLAKWILERCRARPSEILFDERGQIRGFGCDPALVDRAIRGGEPFRTDGCPDAEGALACNRPFGSYRPGESFRDFPFPPEPEDRGRIRRELALSKRGLASLTPRTR